MNPKRVRGKIDWMITLVPLAIVVALCILFFLVPEQSNAVLSQIRFFFGDTFGTYYLVIGLGIFILSLYIACSKYGDIVLGEPNEKPQYSFFAWGSMMFTCGLAADILFYSFSEWVLYATDPHLAEMGSIQDWAGVYPLFHWSFIPWGFYLVLAVAFGFMLHVRKRTRQKYSEACRPILGGYVFGVGSTLTSFIVLGNYSMGLQVTDKADFIAKYLDNGDMYGMIVDMIKTMPGAPVVMVAVLITMIAFYATSFDSIALTASCYSYHTIKDDEQPNKGIQLMWCILLILLPIALLFAESSMNNLQSVSIVAAFPIGVVIVMITVSFLKDAKNYMAESTQ